MATLTRGPLPPGVYWRRRLVLLTAVVVLVVAIAQLLGGGSDGSSEDQASPASAESTERETVTVGPSGAASASPSAGPSAPASTSPSPAAPSSTALPVPSGECDPADVVVEPAVASGTAVAFGPVDLQLRVRSSTTPACTWELSPQSVQIRMTRNGRRLWSSVECPRTVPTSQITVYRDTVSVVPMTWDARRSDADLCGRYAAWAPTGTYTVAAAALGGEPAQSEFTLTEPGATAPSPSAGSSTSPTGGAGGSSAPAPSGSATDSDAGGTSGRARDAGAPTTGPSAGGERDEPGALPDAR